MRTTIDLPKDLRARVLALAARRGDRGLSRIVQEALERFLRDKKGPDRARRVADALGALGSLPSASAMRMHGATRRLRGTWRG